MLQFECRTLFDITDTGVVGHYKSARVPFRCRNGTLVTDEHSWNRARNQQRNWETLTQLISLRTQIIDVTDPARNKKYWGFTFNTEVDVFSTYTDPVGVLKGDSEGVPMLTMLDNDPNIDSVLVPSGVGQNIWFSMLPINNILENKDG